MTDRQPALDLRLELDRLGLRRTRRAQKERGDLAIDRILLEEEGELAALVDLDRVLEPPRVQLRRPEAVDAFQRTSAGEVEQIGLVEQRPGHATKRKTDLRDERREHAGIERDVPTVERR